ncbi:DUF2769 domain-containing protein [Methanosarcina sp.]|uniref:DUF2769 domain-containing protein n=1 Tax=Methanosarcina sp. TaxID=2213 RepID=UPI002ABA782F|nr:DUF2769 domain-containing protein [Methanosarcina sp.]MDY9924867.1 DUF2769 domain-containing protein [Methanosarcina sp.]
MSNGKNTSTEKENQTTPRDRNVSFQRETNFVVPYSRENINRCRCPQCPVQADSKCVKDKLENSKKAMEEMPEGEVPNSEDVPGIYCSTGKAACQDLNPDQQCICNTCDVWNEYVLEEATPSQYFCQNGRAK